MTTMISISEVITTADSIVLTGKDLDAILLNGNLDDEFEEVSFSFARDKKNEMTYIYKVASQKAKNAKSIQEMLDKMVGHIYMINDAFKVQK